MRNEDLRNLTVHELKQEAMNLAKDHPVTRLSANASVRKNSPIFEELARISDLLLKASEIVSEYERHLVSDDLAERRLVRVVERLEEVPSTRVLEAMRKLVPDAIPDDVGLTKTLVWRLERDIDRNIANSQRVAQYGVAESDGDQQALVPNSPLRDYLLSLDVVSMQAHEAREQYDLGTKDGLETVLELLQLRDYSLTITSDMAWHRSGKLSRLKATSHELVFKLYDEIAFGYESHPAVIARRKDTADDDSLIIAAYLSEAYETALEIKDLEREGRLNTSIALHALERIATDMRSLVPNVLDAGKRLPRAKTTGKPR